MSSRAVEVRSLVKQFGARSVLDGVELSLERGEFVALLGKSGSGKTTVLRILAGLEPETAGRILVRPPCTVVFQEPRLIASKRVRENVLLGLPDTQTHREAARQALDEVGLSALSDAYPRTLSGGEAQRTALARALIRKPTLLLLDEPFAALDALTRIKMHELVARLCARHRPAVLLVTHDVDEAILLADRVLVLEHGRIALDRVLDIPRPRRRTDPSFASVRTLLLSALGVLEQTSAPEAVPSHAEM